MVKGEQLACEQAFLFGRVKRVSCVLARFASFAEIGELARRLEDNKHLSECYIRSEPEKRGYRKRLLDLWKTHNTNSELTEINH